MVLTWQTAQEQSAQEQCTERHGNAPDVVLCNAF